MVTFLGEATRAGILIVADHLGDLKVTVAAGGLDSNEHARTLPGTPPYYTIFNSLSIS
jgi:hypothetical protein